MKKILFCLMAAGLMLAFSAAPVLAHSHGLSKAQKLALKAVKEATKKYKDVEEALYDGYVLPDGSECVEIGAGGMGFHYVNFGLMDQYVDPFFPEILLYAPGKHGDLKLVGVEYTVVALGHTNDHPTPRPFVFSDIPDFWDTIRPTIFGEMFDSGDEEDPMPGHEAEAPYHYDLHFWVHKKNPNGDFEPWNPKVSCD